MTLAEISLAAFSAFSGLRLVSYFPQIYRVARDTDGASVISYSTWMLWTGSHLSTGLYAAINLGDRLLAACSGLYALCCITVIVMTAVKRRRCVNRAGGERPASASTAVSRVPNRWPAADHPYAERGAVPIDAARS